MTVQKTGAEEALLGQIVSMASEPELAELLAGHHDLLHPGLVEKLVDLAREKLRVDPRVSLRIAGAALAVADRIADEESQARGLRAQANALWLLNQNQTAVELFDRAAELFHHCGNATEVGRTLSTSIQALIRLGEYGRAIESARRAQEIFERAGDTLRLARLELNVANIHHRQDRFPEALAAYEHAYRQLVPLRDTEAIAVALHNLAVCLIALNDFEKALATHRSARTFCLEHQMPALVVQADYNISYLYYLRGEYSRALEGLKAAALAAHETRDAYHVALCSMDMAEIYVELNMSAEAEEMAEDARKQFQSLGMKYEATKSLAYTAIAAGQQGSTAKSLDLFSRARRQFVEEGNYAWPSLIDIYQALVLFDAGRYSDALPLCSQALEFFRAGKMAGKEILCHLLLGRIRLQTGEAEIARRHCAAAQSALQTTEAPHLRYQSEILMGQIEEAAGDPSKAADHYRMAGATMESLREFLRDEELKIAFMKNKLEVYENLIRLRLDAPGYTSGSAADAEIFGFMEQAKSRTLRDLFVNAHQPRLEADETPAAREMNALRDELSWYYHRLELEQVGPEAASAQHLAKLQQEVRVREAKLLRMMRDLPAGDAGRSGMAGAAALPIDAVRAALGPDTVLVEYFRVGDRFAAAVLSADDLQVVPLASIAELKPALRLLQFQFSKFCFSSPYLKASLAASFRAVNGHLEDLYQALVAPIRHLLRGSRLVLVPHQNLHHVPLHAARHNGKYLIDSFVVTYAPSANVYAMCQAQRANTTGRSLILSVPDERAPLIQAEAEAVAQTLPNAELFSGDQATQAVLRDKGPGSRFIHIGTHGRFRRDNPMFSAIRLGDGYLTLYDLYQFRLPAELITLSGCSTGLNVVAGGDELLGLVRGLLNAGAKTLLLTLWDVQDETSAEMMQDFYARLGKHPDKGVALQAAMCELRTRHPHPFYWAPFVLVGSST